MKIKTSQWNLSDKVLGKFDINGFRHIYVDGDLYHIQYCTCYMYE